MKRITVLIVLIIAAALVFYGIADSPDSPMEDISRTRPLYTGNLTLDPHRLTLQGNLVYYIPHPGSDELVFNTHHNAYRFGAKGDFYFPSFAERVFLFGDSSGEIGIGKITINNTPVEHSVNNTTLSLPLETTLANEILTIEIPISLSIPKIAHRNGANEHALWLGNWLPILAVLEDNNWVSSPYYPAGDPFYSEVADYEIYITLPEGYTLVATGISEQVQSLDGLQTIKITASDVRELAIAVSNQYRRTSELYDGRVMLNIYSYGVTQEIDSRLMDDLNEMMSFFERTVGPYPYPQLNIVQTSFFLGGMEYPTFIILGDRTYQTYESARATMLHELGHQWFYGIMGVNELRDAWFDEGLATFFQNRYTRSKEELDQFYANERIVLSSQLQVYEDIRLGSPLSLYDSWTYYQRVNYRRAALMQYELFSLMGEESYNEFMRRLYDEYKFKVVDRADFTTLAQEVHGSDLSEFFREWFD